MREIRVTIHIDAPIDAVFETVSDHETFACGADTEYCKLTTEGQQQRNGVGAIREICVKGLVFIEEITAFVPPSRLNYVVRSITTKSGRRMPVRHELGRVQLTEGQGGTQVEWTSRFEINIPFIGGVLEVVAGRQSEKGFRELLSLAKARLESQV
ncbi:SRPBCC family protein [Myxococcota bacterium]